MNLGTQLRPRELRTSRCSLGVARSRVRISFQSRNQTPRLTEVTLGSLALPGSTGGTGCITLLGENGYVGTSPEANPRFSQGSPFHCPPGVTSVYKCVPGTLCEHVVAVTSTEIVLCIASQCPTGRGVRTHGRLGWHGTRVPVFCFSYVFILIFLGEW